MTLPEAVLRGHSCGHRTGVSNWFTLPGARGIVTPTPVSVILGKAEHFFHIHCCWAEFQFPFFSGLRKPPSGQDNLIK